MSHTNTPYKQSCSVVLGATASFFFFFWTNFKRRCQNAMIHNLGLLSIENKTYSVTGASLEKWAEFEGIFTSSFL